MLFGTTKREGGCGKDVKGTPEKNRPMLSHTSAAFLSVFPPLSPLCKSNGPPREGRTERTRGVGSMDFLGSIPLFDFSPLRRRPHYLSPLLRRKRTLLITFDRWREGAKRIRRRRRSMCEGCFEGGLLNTVRYVRSFARGLNCRLNL